MIVWGIGITFVAVESVIRLFDLYRTLSWVDVPSHFFAGAAVSAVVLRGLGSRSFAVRTKWALAANLGVSLLWEAVEWIDETITPDPPHLQDVFLWDGFWDIVAALLGGLVLIWVVRRTRSIHD